jgi:hypothetical protein
MAGLDASMHADRRPLKLLLLSQLGDVAKIGHGRALPEIT